MLEEDVEQLLRYSILFEHERLGSPNAGPRVKDPRSGLRRTCSLCMPRLSAVRGASCLILLPSVDFRGRGRRRPPPACCHRLERRTVSVAAFTIGSAEDHGSMISSMHSLGCSARRHSEPSMPAVEVIAEESYASCSWSRWPRPWRAGEVAASSTRPGRWRRPMRSRQASTKRSSAAAASRDQSHRSALLVRRVAAPANGLRAGSAHVGRPPRFCGVC